jgi:P-type Cu+ transporter
LFPKQTEVQTVDDTMTKSHSLHEIGTLAIPVKDSGYAQDLVCGMRVEIEAAKHVFDFGGETYYFCSKGCRESFVAKPGAFLNKTSGVVKLQAHSDARIYTCPMHPEIRRPGPGNCPICGMALEPVMASVADEPNPELKGMQRRFWVGLIFTLPLLVMEMGGHFVQLHSLMNLSMSNAAQFVLATPVVLWSGWPFFARGWQSVLNRSLNMFTLIALGTGVAWLYSSFATIFPKFIPSDFRQPDGRIGVYFEAAAVIVLLVLVGQILELRARDKTSGAIRALLDLSPKMARRVTQRGMDEEIPVEEILVGDVLRVRPGEKVPGDGEVLEGHATIDESMVTGESMPVSKDKGATVIGGTLNGSGSFTMTARRIGADTMLARIVQLVADAQRSRAPIQRLADQISGWFVPLVIAVALAAFAAWSLYGPEPRVTYGMIAAVTVLIIACPCALGLATPMSVMVGVGRAARSGILIKNAEALERFEKVDTLVIDKTGTLTEGKPVVTAIYALEGFTDDQLLKLAASLEQASEHPLAKAIVTAATERKIFPEQPEGFISSTGKGVAGKVGKHLVVLGNEKHFEDLKLPIASLSAQLAELRKEGATVLLAAIDGKVAGLFAISDQIKKTTPQAISDLKSGGFKIVVLTGDNAVTANAIAKKLGIDDVRANILPEQKAEVIKELQKAGRIVAMAGDGVNDAPALAAADVGIAMGTGADVAIESASITLLRGDLRGVVQAQRLSRATMRNIRQNLFFSFVYNAVGVPVAAGVLYPFFGILLSPILGAAAMALSSVSVIANALRLRVVKL